MIPRPDVTAIAIIHLPLHPNIMSQTHNASGLEPTDTIIFFENDTLTWETPDKSTTTSIPLNALVTILPPPDSGSDANGAAYTALYLDSPTDHNSNNGNDISEDTRLRTASIPLSNLKENPALDSELQRYILPRLPAHLDALDSTGSATPVEIHIVISVLAGTKKGVSFFENALRPLFAKLNVSAYKVHRTESANTITELCEHIFVPRARDGVRQTVILLSGDGGVIDVIKVFSEAYEGRDSREDGFVPPTLCTIPMGTGNATANSTAPENDGTLGLATLVRGGVRTLSTFRVTLAPGAAHLVEEGMRKEAIPESKDGVGHVYGAVVVSWGMHASLVADSDTAEYRKYGVDRFKMAAKELLWPADGSGTHRYRGKVRLTVKGEDGNLETFDVNRSEHMYVLITLVPQLERGFTISPASKSLDGQLRIVHFGPLTPERAMGLMDLAYQGGKHVEEPEVGYTAVEKVRIEFEEEEERWRRACVDGKIVLVPRDGWIEVERDERGLLGVLVA